MNYAALIDELKGHQKAEAGYHTTIEANDPVGADREIEIVLYDTTIMRFLSNGDIVLNVGRWKTPLTKSRINHYLPHGWELVQMANKWRLYDGHTFHTFYNGFVIHTT